MTQCRETREEEKWRRYCLGKEVAQQKGVYLSHRRFLENLNRAHYTDFTHDYEISRLNKAGARKFGSNI